MRDMLYISCLFACFLLLAAQFPSNMEGKRTAGGNQAAYASFVELPSSVHASCLEAAKTTWQVRSGSRGRTVIGSLDAGIPLLADSFPPMERPALADIEVSFMPAGPADVCVYSLLPSSEGVDSPAFSMRSTHSGGKNSADDGSSPPFTKADMLSVDGFKKLKEIMQ